MEYYVLILLGNFTSIVNHYEIVTPMVTQIVNLEPANLSQL